jgi:predicted amidohydrolase
MTRPRFLLALGQLCSTEDLGSNLATCARLAERAKDAGAGLLLLPEDFAFLGRRESDRRDIAETLDADHPGPILGALIEWARRHQMWLIGGGMAERVADPADRRVHNTCVVVSPAGELVACYRKIHLFDVDIPGSVRLAESEATAPGADLLVVRQTPAPIGLSICYDLRFPELYRELARRGAEILAVPSAFTAPTGRAHWHTLLRARAIENQCYVAAANQSGRHNERRESYGHSALYDPWGTLVAEVDDGVGLAVGEIDPGLVAATRRRMPCLQHRVL